MKKVLENISLILTIDSRVDVLKTEGSVFCLVTPSRASTGRLVSNTAGHGRTLQISHMAIKVRSEIYVFIHSDIIDGVNSYTNTLCR